MYEYLLQKINNSHHKSINILLVTTLCFTKNTCNKK